MKKGILFLAIILVAAGFVIWWKLFHNQMPIPTQETPSRVPQSEIKNLLGRDSIPSIDNPIFMAPAEASGWLDDSEPGIAFSRGATHRFYPYQILVWHEIVNDTAEGERTLVTYCPLCLTGFVFDPLVKGERIEFGTSGKLWKSNLVMYDRKTDSLWSQILGEAIAGEMIGAKLELLPSDQVLFGKWRATHPDGQVLSRETGATRFYGTSPYGDYFSSVGFARSLAGGRDTRLTPDTFIFGIVTDGKAKAYPVEAVKQKGEVVDEFAGQTLVLKYDKALDVVRVYRRLPEGGQERINPFSSFWFAWTAAHQDTELYK
ncbi:DUF3179 domain-containing protein [Candidatus Uhrbacteria bacterium]|nr:DUF3179 domain-containing protein [Candidatus Uhrbacteria bacterium]